MNTPVENLLVSFSGGETSAFMAQWIQKHLQGRYKNIVYVFANTGLENEETLEFVEKCDKHFGLSITWVEAEVTNVAGVGTKHTLVNFKTASRNGEPFEAIISKYGIPNQAAPHCTRELKQNPIKSFAKSVFGKAPYHTAIGIRADEADRLNPKYKEMGFVYPLIHKEMLPSTKPMVNFYWRSMPFRLNLKGYQGNCVTCWKKSDKKLFQIAKENPKAFDFMSRMEKKYKRFGPEFLKEPTGDLLYDRTFFRNHRSAEDMLAQAENFKGEIQNDADVYTWQLDLIGGESCEVFSECGN